MPIIHVLRKVINDFKQTPDYYKNRNVKFKILGTTYQGTRINAFSEIQSKMHWRIQTYTSYDYECHVVSDVDGISIDLQRMEWGFIPSFDKSEENFTPMKWKFLRYNKQGFPVYNRRILESIKRFSNREYGIDSTGPIVFGIKSSNVNVEGYDGYIITSYPQRLQGNISELQKPYHSPFSFFILNIETGFYQEGTVDKKKPITQEKVFTMEGTS